MRPALLLMPLVLAAGCVFQDDAAHVNADDKGALFVAIASASDDAATPLTLDVAAPADATGVILCPGSDLARCKRGLGSFQTTDHHRDLGGAKVFRTNLQVAPSAGLELSVVAHDARGAAIAGHVVKMEAR